MDIQENDSLFYMLMEIAPGQNATVVNIVEAIDTLIQKRVAAAVSEAEDRRDEASR